MLKKAGIAVCVLAFALVVSGLAKAQEATETTEAPAVVTTDVVPAAAESVGNTVCPITGMEISEPGKYTIEYEGKIYNLCSETCQEEFIKDPATYVAKVEEELAAVKTAESAPATEEVVPAASTESTM